MRLLRYPAPGWLAGLLFLTSASLRAEAPPDPLRLVPNQAELLVQVDQPRKLVEAVTNLDVLKQLQALGAIKELYDSTNSRRFYQLVGYFEKQLGVPWPEMLDRLAGGGAVLGVKFGGEPAPLLAVVQGTDEALVRKFTQLALEVTEQELARQESKERLQKSSYRDVETLRLGKQFHAAVAGSALLLSNNETALHLGIDLFKDGSEKSMANVTNVKEARKLLPANPLAWMWLSYEPIKKAPQAKEVFAQPRNDVNLTVLFGGLLDVARRSPYLCAGLVREKDGFLTTFRMPRGREGLPAELAVHVPPDEQAGALPLLEPASVLYSTSFYLDLAKFWEQRAKLFNDKQNKSFEDFDKNSGLFLLGNKFSKLSAKLGARHRFVATFQGKNGYQNAQDQRIPAFALVSEMREKSFGKTAEALLRGVALVAGTQLKLKMVEEKHGDVTIIGYRFPEENVYRNDDYDIRFNYSPCFAAVGDQFIAASTMELCHELADLVLKEISQDAKNPPRKGSPAAVRTQVYSAGGADYLRVIEDQLFAQTILDRAVSPAEAKQQVQTLVDWVRRLGVLQLEEAYGQDRWRYDFRLLLK